jgi:hypothetical protein
MDLFNDRRPLPEPEPEPEPPPRRKPFRHTDVFEPAQADALNPKVHPGSQPIAPGTPVKRVAQVGDGRGSLHWIQDREGNQMSVFKSSLKPREVKRPAPSED